jgi:hypothetical protein
MEGVEGLSHNDGEGRVARLSSRLEIAVQNCCKSPTIARKQQLF